MAAYGGATMGSLRCFRYARTASLIAACVVMCTAFASVTVARVRRDDGQFSATAASGQPPKFEVASVKHRADSRGPTFLDGPDPSKFTMTNATAKMLIEFAYDIKDFQLSGGPSWIDADRFDIDAKVDDSTANQIRHLPQDQQEAQKDLMLQSLLADRFNLKVTRGTKDLPAYAIVVARGGSKLTEVPPPPLPETSPQPPPSPPARGGHPPLPPGADGIGMHNGLCTIEANAEPLSELASMLSFQLGRPVVDRTRMKGTYTFTLQYALEPGPEAAPLPPTAQGTGAETAASLFSAIQEQLGLRLESTKAPVETIVIDHIEEPAPN